MERSRWTRNAGPGNARCGVGRDARSGCCSAAGCSLAVGCTTAPRAPAIDSQRRGAWWNQAVPLAVPAAGVPTAAVEPTHVTIAYASSSSANSLLLLAQQQGYFQANGLDAELVYAADGRAGRDGRGAGAGDVVGLRRGARHHGQRRRSAVRARQHESPAVRTRGRAWSCRPATTFAASGLASAASGRRRTSRTRHHQISGAEPDRDATYVQVGNTRNRLPPCSTARSTGAS